MRSDRMEHGFSSKRGAAISKEMQERVQKLYQLPYDYRNWSWLLDPQRPSDPPIVSRPTTSDRDGEVQAHASGKESASARVVSTGEAEF